MQNRVETPPLLKAESVMLGIRHEKEGKLRVTYTGWDDAKVVLDGHVFRVTGRSVRTCRSRALSPGRGRAALDQTAHRRLPSCFGPWRGRA